MLALRSRPPAPPSQCRRLRLDNVKGKFQIEDLEGNQRHDRQREGQDQGQPAPRSTTRRARSRTRRRATSDTVDNVKGNIQNKEGDQRGAASDAIDNEKGKI